MRSEASSESLAASQTAMLPVLAVKQDFVAERLARIEVRNPWNGEDRDMPILVKSPDLPKSRDRHHSVSQPIRRPDK